MPPPARLESRLRGAGRRCRARGLRRFQSGGCRRAGRRLLESGPVRIKPVRATGGRGQSVARDAAELQRRLAAIDPVKSSRTGWCWREPERGPHLQRRSGDGGRSHGQLLRRAAPDAQQPGSGGLWRIRPDVVRGGFDALLALDVSPEIRRAVGQARRYDAAVRPASPASSRRAATTTWSSAATRRADRARACWSNPGGSAAPAAPRSPRWRSSARSRARGCARPLRDLRRGPGAAAACHGLFPRQGSAGRADDQVHGGRARCPHAMTRSRSRSTTSTSPARWSGPAR